MLRSRLFVYHLLNCFVVSPLDVSSSIQIQRRGKTGFPLYNNKRFVSQSIICIYLYRFVPVYTGASSNSYIIY